MSKASTYITGRALSLFLAVGFNILAVKVMVPAQYAVYAVLIAGSSLVNTLGGLGSQRLVPKVIGMAGTRMTYHRAITIYRTILVCRTAALLAVGVGTYFFFQWSLGHNVQLGNDMLLPYVIFCLFAALYLDVEAASQSLNQQKLSRMVAIGEPMLRLIVVSLMALGLIAKSAHSLIMFSCITQGAAALSLVINNFRNLYNGKRRQVDLQGGGPGITLREMLHLGSSAYIGAVAWISTGPATLRLVAATVLPAQGIAVLSFVQSLGSSFQRYSPGSLMLPFVEAQVMRTHHSDSDKSKVAALLGLIWKVDMIVSFVVICAITPASAMLLSVGGRPEFAAYGAYIGLVILPVPFGTVNRVLEVGSVYIDNFSAILKSSALTLISLALLFAFKNVFGIVFILIVPIIDNILRCGALDFQLRQRGLIGVVNWRALLIVTGLCMGIMLTAHLTASQPYALQIAFAITGGVFSVLALKLSGTVTAPEIALIDSRMPRQTRGWIDVVFGKAWRPKCI